MQQLASILNKEIAPSRIIFVAAAWIVLVVVQLYTGIFFTNHLLNVILEGSAVIVFEVMAVTILFSKISKVIKILWLLILLPASLLFFFWLVQFTGEVDDIVHSHQDPVHRVIRSEPLGAARLVVYLDGGGALNPDASDAELEKDICPWLKMVKPVGGGGSGCYIELTRIDAHHIKCVAKSCTDTSYYDEEIVTDL